MTYLATSGAIFLKGSHNVSRSRRMLQIWHSATVSFIWTDASSFYFHQIYFRVGRMKLMVRMFLPWMVLNSSYSVHFKRCCCHVSTEPAKIQNYAAATNPNPHFSILEYFNYNFNIAEYKSSSWMNRIERTAQVELTLIVCQSMQTHEFVRLTRYKEK